MRREFFNLENIMLGGLFLILLIYSGFMMSCRPLDDFSVDTFSVDRDDEVGENFEAADRRRSSRRNRRPCEDRDSCQDSCDYMFRNSRSRSECYDLDLDDVSELEYVFDELHASSINKRSLEDIDADDLEEFLEIDVDGWLDIIAGTEGAGHDNHESYSSREAKDTLEWIAENEDVARVIDRVDEHYDILYHLFLQLGSQSSRTFSLTSAETEGNGSVTISWSSNEVRLGSHRIRLEDQVLKFVLNFIGVDAQSKFSGRSFISYSKREDNEQAAELAHESLKRFCEDARGGDDEFPDENIQQCMLAVYCSVYAEENSDYIFDDVLSSHSAGPDDCAVRTLVRDDDDRLDRLF